jgi:hypothetical protein
VQPIVNFLFKKYVYDKEFIRHRGVASFFIFFSTLLTIPAGIVTGLIRFIISAVATFLAMPQIFAASTPDLTNKYVLLDAAHKTYLAGVYVHHLHNHPMVCTFVRYLADEVKTRKKASQLAVLPDQPHQRASQSGDSVQWASPSRKGWRETIPRNKRWLILLLINMPWLKEHRKAALRAKKEEEEQEAEEAKESKISIAPNGKASPLALELRNAIVECKDEVEKSTQEHNAIVERQGKNIKLLRLAQHELETGSSKGDHEEAVRRLIEHVRNQSGAINSVQRSVSKGSCNTVVESEMDGPAANYLK